MLNKVPQSINRSARLVVLRHPNAMEGALFRKTLLRSPEDSEGTLIGGMPTIGGMGVLDGEDEADYEYTEQGDIKILFTGQFIGEGNNHTDSGAGLNYPNRPVEALIEFVELPDNPEDEIIPKKSDVISVEIGANALIYEILEVTGSVNIPPYTRKYVLGARSDSEFGI